MIPPQLGTRVHVTNAHRALILSLNLENFAHSVGRLILMNHVVVYATVVQVGRLKLGLPKFYLDERNPRWTW